jgi:hypothetical protein
MGFSDTGATQMAGEVESGFDICRFYEVAAFKAELPQPLRLR